MCELSHICFLNDPSPSAWWLHGVLLLMAAVHCTWFSVTISTASTSVSCTACSSTLTLLQSTTTSHTSTWTQSTRSCGSWWGGCRECEVYRESGESFLELERSEEGWSAVQSTFEASETSELRYYLETNDSVFCCSSLNNREDVMTFTHEWSACHGS